MKTKKLLLTQSQVSVVLSAIIVVSFAAILFLAGVVIQQRNVASLHAALKPRAVSQEIKHLHLERRHTSTLRTQGQQHQRWWKNLMMRIGVGSKEESQAGSDVFSWNRYAYAQVLHEPADMCNALILFAELQRGKSPIPRLLLFPQQWMLSKEGADAEIDHAKKLLKKASRRYRAVLVPFNPSPGDEGPLSTATLFAMTDYDIIAVPPVPGMVINAERLDEILVGREFDMPVTEILTDVETTSATTSSGIVIVKPSLDTWRAYNTSSPPEPDRLVAGLEAYGTVAENEESQTSETFITTSQTLRTSTSAFDSAHFYKHGAYVHLLDSGFASPEYDIPYEEIVKARPRNGDQAFVWEKTEATYKDLRYRVCGLELLEWTRPDQDNDSSENKSEPREDL